MEDLNLSLSEDVELQPVGTVSSIIQQLGKHVHIHPKLVWAELFKCISGDFGGSRINPCPISVIVQSLKDAPALTDDSILFSSDRVALAKVGEPPLKRALPP